MRQYFRISDQLLHSEKLALLQKWMICQFPNLQSAVSVKANAS